MPVPVLTGAPIRDLFSTTLGTLSTPVPSSGVDRLALLGMYDNSAFYAGGGVTAEWGGVPMTLALEFSPTADVFLALFFLVNPPLAASLVSFDGLSGVSQLAFFTAFTAEHVNQTTPLGTVVSAAGVSLIAVPSAVGALPLMYQGHYSGSPPAVDPPAVAFDVWTPAFTNRNFVVATDVGAAPTVTITTTAGPDASLGIIGVSLLAPGGALAAGPSVQSVVCIPG
jgi:hypothetical protein